MRLVRSEPTVACSVRYSPRSQLGCLPPDREPYVSPFTQRAAEIRDEHQRIRDTTPAYPRARRRQEQFAVNRHIVIEALRAASGDEHLSDLDAYELRVVDWVAQQNDYRLVAGLAALIDRAAGAVR